MSGGSRNVHKTRQALRDLSDIASWFGAESLELELRFLDEVEDAFAGLAVMPEKGVKRTYLHATLRDLRMWPMPAFPNILIFYFLRNRDVEVIRVLHAARDIDAVMSKRSPKRRLRRL